MWLPDRRTLIVLTSLVGAMTLVSGLLLALEPSPVALSLSRPVSLIAMDQDNADIGELSWVVTTPQQADRWDAIVIHESGRLSGSAQQMHRDHQEMGLGGLAYHFVVGTNQSGDPVEAGYRWLRQLEGAFVVGPNADQPNPRTIGVCLIGDSNTQSPSEQQLSRLIQLVHRLQVEHGIPADQVDFQGAADGAGRSSPMFPLAWFRQQLLRFDTP